MKRHLTLIIIALLIAICASARQPHSGYRGFFEWSNDLRTEELDFWGRQTEYYTGISTAHGYQINPMFFVGAGIGLEHCNKYDSYIAPLFAMGRADFKFGAFTPYADVRLGANLANGGGVYFSPTIGYRFNWGRKVGINLGLGMSLNGYKCDLFDIVIGENGYTNAIYVGSEHRSRPYFTFRVGFDF